MKKLSLEQLNRIEVDEFKTSQKTPIIVVLDNIRSMNNIGSVFRSCDAFRIEQIILCGITATPPHRDITKTALGSTESVEWTYFENSLSAVNELKTNNIKIYAVEQVDKPILLNEFEWDFKDKIALIFGNEVFGVTEELLPLCDGVIEIPQIGTKHSLNISVSAGIVLWHLFNKWYNDKKDFI